MSDHLDRNKELASGLYEQGFTRRRES